MNHVIIPATGAVPVLLIGMSEKPVKVKLSEHGHGLLYMTEGRHSFLSIELPGGQWEVLGLSSELTERQKSKICALSTIGEDEDIVFYDYVNNTWGLNVSESLSSLMQSVGAYTVNPRKKPDATKVLESFPCGEDYAVLDELRDDYEAAQKTTFPYWLVLVKKQ